MRREQMDGDTEMTEETAVRIAEALESIKDAMGGMMAMAISFTVIFTIAFLLYVASKD